MKHIDLGAIELQAKRMHRAQMAWGLLKDLLAAALIGCILSSPIFYQMGVDNGWWN